MIINIQNIEQIPDPWDTRDGDIVVFNGFRLKNIRNEFWAPLDFGAPAFTTATLPPTVGLLAGTEVIVTDYNGNIARLIGGSWRYMRPFVTSWATRPPANAVPAGTELQVTDYANQMFVTDGVGWRPAQGRILLGQKSADGGASLATISLVTQGEFAIVKPVIKAGLIQPNSKIRVEGLVAKAGTAGTFVPVVYLGKTNSMSTDPAIGSVGVTVNIDGTGTRWDMLACFGASTSLFLRTGNTAPQGQSAGNLYAQSTNIDTTVDMYVTFAVLIGNAADTYALKAYSVWLEG